MAPRRSRAAALCVGVALAAAGCGSTVQGSGAVASVGDGTSYGASAVPNGEGLTAPRTDAHAPVVDGNQLPSANGTPLTGPGVTGGPDGERYRDGGVATPAAGPSAGVSGPGVTADKIYVGISYSTDADYLNKAAGANNFTKGPEQQEAKAIVDDINSHGGIAGRTVVPVWHVYDGTSTASLSAQEQAACADWTQDHKVFAVMEAGTETLNNCLSKAGVVMVSDNLATYDAATLAKHPTLVHLCCPTLDRIAAEQARALLAQDYFAKWNTATGNPGAAPTKVGVLTYDDGNFAQPVDKILAPAIRKAGYPTEIVKIKTPESSGDLGGESAAVSSAVLKFRSDGVSHVIIFDASGGMGLFFLREADSQKYYPRYGINTGNAAEGLLEGGLATPKQMNGAVGFSWTPYDLPEDKNPDNGPYSNGTRRHCMAVMKANGISFEDADPAIALLYCDTLYYLQYAADRAGRVLNASTFLAAVDATGAGFDNGSNLDTFLGPGRHDAASGAYFMGFSSSCGCITYRGKRYDIP